MDSKHFCNNPIAYSIWLSPMTIGTVLPSVVSSGKGLRSSSKDGSLVFSVLDLSSASLSDIIIFINVAVTTLKLEIYRMLGKLNTN
ncbi:hypothetical protein V1478_015591 [Vespula squamosa]|uniref:Uncharacterized protein n=1 Tax=Vespula squamosa TaxID=30214 RepID=A0ABD2A193_VESSQ